MRNVWFVFLLVLSVPAFAAVEVKDGKVTADVQSELLRDVVNQIGTQSGLQVTIDSSVANDMVYANFQDLPVGAAMRKLLEGTDVNYAVIAGADGKPTAIYVSKSETPGAPPKKLDSRPVAPPGRGVVTPVMPQMPQPAPTQPNIPQNGNIRNPGNQPKDPNATDQKPGNPAGGNVPTAGSFSGAPPPSAQPNRVPDNKPLIQNNGVVSGDDDDEDDDDDE